MSSTLPYSPLATHYSPPVICGNSATGALAKRPRSHYVRCSRPFDHQARPARRERDCSAMTDSFGTDEQGRKDDRTPPRRDRRVIAIRGAREHNLKNVDLDIPRDRLVVFTGLSG